MREAVIPDWLKPRPDEEDTKFDTAFERYKEHFKSYPTTMTCDLDGDELADTLNYCVDNNISFDRLFGITFDGDRVY